MTVLARKNGIILGKRGSTYIIDTKTTSTIVSSKHRANEIYNKLTAVR